MPTVYRMHRASLGLCNRTWHQNRKIGRSDKNGRRTVYNSEGDGMTIRVSEVIRGWLGWCPDTQMRILGQVRKPNDVTVTSSGSRSFQSNTIHWAILFRNQTILLTIGSFLTGLVMFVWLGNGWS